MALVHLLDLFVVWIRLAISAFGQQPRLDFLIVGYWFGGHGGVWIPSLFDIGGCHVVWSIEVRGREHEGLEGNRRLRCKQQQQRRKTQDRRKDNWNCNWKICRRDGGREREREEEKERGRKRKREGRRSEKGTIQVRYSARRWKEEGAIE
jgi:hypothetical protein